MVQKQQQIQQQRLLEQQASRRGLNFNQLSQQLNPMAMVGMNPVISMAAAVNNANPLPLLGMTAQLNNPSAISITPLPQQQQQQQGQTQQQNQPQQQTSLPGILRSTLSQPPLNQKTDNRQPSPHSTLGGQLQQFSVATNAVSANSNNINNANQQNLKDCQKENSTSPTPSWHVPQMTEALRNLAANNILSNLVSNSSISLKEASNSNANNVSSSRSNSNESATDSSFKIILGSSGSTTTKNTTSSSVVTVSSQSSVSSSSNPSVTIQNSNIAQKNDNIVSNLFL